MLEIKSYDDWSEDEEELDADQVNNLKKYTDYVRSSYYKAGQLTKEIDDEIVSGVQDRLYEDGVLTEESSEDEVKSKVSGIAGSVSDQATDARFVLEHLKANSTPQSQDPRTQALTNYLALKDVAPDRAEEFRTVVDEVTADRKLVRDARISAADRGDYSVVAVDEDDGTRSFYTGPTAGPDKIAGEVDTLIKAGAISTSDLFAVNDSVRTVNGGLSNSSENARYEMFRRTVGEKAKTDKGLNDLLSGQAAQKKQEITESQQTLGEDILQGAKTVVTYPFAKLADAIVGTGRFLMGEEKAEPQYSLDTKLSDVLGGDENIRKRFSAAEIEKFSDALVTTAAGPVYRADRPETGISMDSMGNPLIASALLPKDDLFEKALAAAPLNKEQQGLARVQRDALLKSSTPDLLKIILDEEPEAASALAKFKADGKSDTDFVKSWVSDSNNYSGFETRLEQFGKGALKTVADIPLGLAALSGNEWAVKEMGKMMDDQARRKEYSRLFGDEYGLGFEIINTIPQVATDIGLTIGTGGLFAGAKTLAKAGAATGRTTLRTAAKIGLSTADETAANAFKSAITVGGEGGTGTAIKEMGRSLGTQFAENAPLFTTSFVRSASSTYASIYNQLPDDMSHEEKHKDSLGYALAAGLSTGVITTGMSFLGRGGVEDLATKRIRAMLGGETDEAVAAAGGKFVPVDKLNYRQAKSVYQNLRTESASVTDAAFNKALRGAIGSTYKNYLKTTFGGALNESVEEALDQAIQMKLEDASLNRETPLAEQVNQIFTAGVIGGALGGLTSGATQFGPVKKSELAMVFEARASALENVAKRLRETNSSATAETVQRLIDDARSRAAEANKVDAQARSEAEALKQKTIYSDPNERQLESTESELTMLGDLVGERVSAAGFYGTVQVDDSGSAHLVTKSGEVVHLGSKYEKAAGRVSSFPQLMATATQVGNVPAGTPYISRGKKDTTKIAMPSVSEANKPEDFLGVIKNEEGNVIQLVVKNATLMSNQDLDGMDIKIGNRYQINSLARYYNVDLNALQDLTPVAEAEDAANANDIDSIGDSAVSPEAKEAVVTAKTILQQGPTANLYKAFMAGDSSKAKFKQTVSNLTAGELDSVAQTASAFYDWATSNENIPPEVRPRLIQGAEDLKSRVALAAQIHIDNAAKLEGIKWDTISDEEKAAYNEELGEEQDKLEAELNASAAARTTTLSDKDKAATQAALDAAQRKLSKGVSEPQQATTKKGEAEGNEVIEGDDPQKILSNLIQRLRAVNDEVPIIVESAEGFISPAAANRQIKQLKAAIQQATESEDTEQLKLLSDQLSKVTTRVYTMKEAEQIKTKLKFFVNELYKDPEYIAEASERLGRLESAMSVGKRILSSRKSSLRKQIAELIPEDTDATDLTDDETQLADMLSRIEGTRPPKPEVLPKPKKIKRPAGEDWSTEDKLHLFRSEAEERAFNSLVDDGIIISDLSKYGATISAREQELLGFEGPQLFTKTRYNGDPTNPNKYIKGKHILLARKVLERFPLVEPPADASTTKSKNNFTDPVAGKYGKVDLPVYRDKAQFISEGVFTNDPRTSREFIYMGIPVVIPPDLIKKHKNPKDPFFINKSIDFDEDSGVVLSVLDPITREPKMFSGEQTMVSNEGYLPYRTNRIMSLISGVMEPSPQYLKLLGNTVSGRQPVYGRGLPAREYLVDFRRLLFEGEAIDPEVSQLGGIETSAGYRYLRNTYGLSDESIASASTAAISEYTLGIYEYAMGQALRSYVSKAMLFAKNKGMDAVVKQALKDARAEYGDTLSKAELEQIPDSYFLKYVEPDKRVLKDLDPIRVISQFFYSNNKDAIAESIVSMYPEFGSSSSGAVISKYAESLFDRVSNPKGNLFTGPKQPFSILDHYGDLYQRAEIRRRKYKSFGGIGEENASILDRLVTSGEAKSSTAAKGMDDLTTDPLFVKGYDEVTGDPEATYAYRDSLRTTLIKTVNSEPQLQAAFQDIAGSFNEELVTLEGERLLDLLANVISNAGDRNVSLAVTNRLYSLRNIAGLRAAGIMAELGWLPPVAGFKAVAPEVRATTELESPEASRERLLQIISAAKDSSYRAANMATPEEEATYRARLVEAVQMAQPEIQQAISVANEKSIQAELRDKYRESMSRVLYKLEDGEEAFASAVSGLRNDITKGQDRLVKLEELIAESDANISDVKLGVGKISKDQEALRPKFNELSNYLQSLIEKKSEGDNTVDPRLEKATAAFEKVNQQMDKYNGIISRYASNLKLFERERNKFVNEQGALTKYLDRTTPIATQLEGMTYAEAVKQIRASRRSADLDSGTLTKVSESMKLKAQRIAAEKAETIPADEKPYQKVVREAAAAAAQLRYNSERGNLYKASNIATNAQLEAAARTANTRDLERYGINSNDPESMLGALRAMAKSNVESHREVANLLLLAPDFIRSVRFGIVDVRSDWSGLYDAQTNTVLLNVAGHNGRGLADVILHEYLHAATVTYFKNPRTAEQRAAVKRIGQIRQLAVAQATKKGLMKFAHVRDGLANDAEFLTYTLTAPEFQASLSLLTPPNQSSILSRVIDAILSFFGKKNFKLQEAVRELLDFTQMGLVNFHTYNVSTKRDTNALIEKGQYIRNEMEDTMFLQGLLDDIMSGRNQDVYFAANREPQAAEGAGVQYEVYDKQTDEVVWTGTRRDIARQVQDRRDNAYGGYRYGVRQSPQGSGADAAYLAAVEAGDMETAQQLVNEAARRAGYLEKFIRGDSQKGVNTFDPDKAGSNTFGRGSNIGFFFTGINNQTTAQTYVNMGGGNGEVRTFFLSRKKPFLVPKAGVSRADELGRYLIHNLFPVRSKDIDVIDYTKPAADWGRSNIDRDLALRLGIEAREWLLSRGYDSVKYAEEDIEAARETIILNPTQIKSADPVTYDDNGNVIPLSQRFRSTSDDIRYTRIGERGGRVVYHMTSNRESLDAGLVQRDLGFSVSATREGVMSSPTLNEPKGSQTVVQFILNGNGMDYNNPQDRAVIDGIYDTLAYDPTNPVPLDVQLLTELRSRGVDFVDNFNGIGEANGEIHVLKVNALRPFNPTLDRTADTAIDVLGEIRRITPAGINIEIDDTMVGAMGANRRRPNTIIVNSKLINDIGAGLSAANAKAAVRTAVDEELAHLASYTVFTEQDFVNLANEMGPAMLDRIADIYYSNLIPDFNERTARIAADRESGALRDSDLVAEFVRMEMTDMAVGRTREEHIAFLYTNPSLLSRWLEALKAFISRLKQRFSEAPTTGTAARISQASRAFRKLREGGVLPEPEESAANELGDSVAFFNALNGDIIEGQEDRTRYMLPIAASGNKNQVDTFWKKIEDKYYNFPLELRKLLALREGTLSEVEYTMENFSKVFPKLRDAALARGAAIEDIGKVLGTTAPAIQRQARKQIKDKVKQFKIANAKDPDLERKATEYESQITSVEADKFFAQFRQEQKIVENNLRASGFGELVDFLVEFRQEINKYKAVVNFDESNDVYLTRSFKFFSSEGWALAARAGGKVTIDGKEVDFDKLRAAALTHFEWEVDEAAKKKKEVLTKDQRDQRLVQALDNYLRKLELEAEQSKELGPVQSLRKDLNRMLTKQDFDSPLRKLLGEVEDPFENAVRTIYSVGRMAANERFLENFADQAIAIGVASRDRKPNMELLFPPSQSAELGDLAGLYVDSKVAAAFREELGINMRSQDSRSAGMINNIGRWLSKFSGLTITAKTLGSIGFYPRNILGGIALTTAQGIVNPTDIARSTRLAIAASLPISKTQADSKEMRNELRRLTELQIIRDDTRGRIAMDMLKGFVASTDEQLEELMTEIIEAQATGNVDKVSKRFGGLQKAGISTVEFLAGLNNVIDSAFKLNAYFYELNVLKKAYGNSETESTLEAMAAQKVKRTFPTHSDQISFAKSFGRSPFSMLVLPFVRWKSEVFRTMINTIPLAVQEIKSGNDVLARRGAKRLTGFTATMLFGGSVYGGLFATLFGFLTDDEDDERAALRKLSEEEMEALRLALPEWQRNHGVFAQKLRDGGIQVIDLTNILPYSQLTDIVGLATRGDVKGIADYLTSEIIGTQIAASTAIEISQNRDEYDQPIWLPTDDGFSATVKMLMHLGKGTLLPSIVDKAVKVGRYGEQNAKEMIVGEFTGVRPIIHKAADIEYRGMRNLKDSADAVVSLLYPLSGGRALDVDDVGDVIDEHQSASNENQRKLHNFIKGMKSMGSTEASLANTAQQMKFSKQRFGAALDGINIPWVPNKQWFQKMYDNKIRTGEQNPDEIAAKINEILSRKPDFYNVNVD